MIATLFEFALSAAPVVPVSSRANVHWILVEYMGCTFFLAICIGILLSIHFRLTFFDVRGLYRASRSTRMSLKAHRIFKNFPGGGR